MSEVEQFELGTILTVTERCKFVDNLDKVWKLLWFVCDGNMEGPIEYKVICHLIAIHPELKKIRYQKDRNKNEFLIEQEKKYGNTLPVTKLGVPLPEEYQKQKQQKAKKRTLRPNNK